MDALGGQPHAIAKMNHCRMPFMGINWLVRSRSTTNWSRRADVEALLSRALVCNELFSEDVKEVEASTFPPEIQSSTAVKHIIRPHG